MKMERFDYAAAKVENISCNLCGTRSFYVLARRLSNGQPVQTCMCKRCGLVYVNPRMTRDEYDRYYKTYYHNERLITKGRLEKKSKDPAGEGFRHAYRFGIALAEDFRAWIKPGLVVDVGSSYGGVLAGIRDTISDVKVIGIEPSKEDADYANDHDVITHNTLFENFEADVGSLSTIICVRTFNHLLDPRGFLVWSHEHLALGGVVILTVKNFRQQCRRAGSVAASVQIDHPFMFTPETLAVMVCSVGFEIVYMDADEHKKNSDLLKQKERGLSFHHIRLVAKRVRKEPLSRGAKNARGNAARFRLQLFPICVKFSHIVAYGKWRKTLGLKNL